VVQYLLDDQRCGVALEHRSTKSGSTALILIASSAARISAGG
jgi:hypothetical protein